MKLHVESTWSPWLRSASSQAAVISGPAFDLSVSQSGWVTMIASEPLLRPQSLRVSPAIAAGISERLWSMDDIVALIEAAEGEPKKRGPYKKRVAASA
jgi:hypothetical protein